MKYIFIIQEIWKEYRFSVFICSCSYSNETDSIFSLSGRSGRNVCFILSFVAENLKFGFNKVLWQIMCNHSFKFEKWSCWFLFFFVLVWNLCKTRTNVYSHLIKSCKNIISRKSDVLSTVFILGIMVSRMELNWINEVNCQIWLPEAYFFEFSVTVRYQLTEVQQNYPQLMSGMNCNN